jgi:hypothetical protein
LRWWFMRWRLKKAKKEAQSWYSILSFVSLLIRSLFVSDFWFQFKEKISWTFVHWIILLTGCCKVLEENLVLQN